MYKLSRSWVEGEADWEQASDEEQWADAGGDYSSRAIATATCPRSEGKTWVEYNVLSTVEEFVANPAANFGVIIVNSRMSQEIDFVSSEGEDQEFRPKLTVTYETVDIAPAISKSAPVVGEQLTVHTSDNSVHLRGTAITAPVAVRVVTPVGRLVYSGELSPGQPVLNFATGAGMFLVSCRTGSGKESVFPALVP